MNLKLVAFAVFVLFFVELARADLGDGCFSSWGMMGYAGGFMWIFGIIFWILLIIALVLFIVWLVKQLQKNPRRKR